MKYFTKRADLIMGPKDRSKAKITAGGLYIGTDKDHDKKLKQYQDLLREHKSIQTARGAYKKLNPNDYTTTMFKFENAPKKPLLFGRKKYKKNLEDYETRSKQPRIFLRAGKAGGDRQGFFYKEVARGIYDKDLQKGSKIYV